MAERTTESGTSESHKLKLKAIYAPLNVPGFEQVGAIAAFRQRFNCRIFDYLHCAKMEHKDPNEELVRVVDEFGPRLIHLQLHGTRLIDASTLEALRARGIFITQWYGDMRDEPDGHVVDVGKVINWTLLASKGQLDWFRKRGVKCAYWSVGVEEREPMPDTSKWPYAVIMTANKYQPGTFPNAEARIELARMLTDRFEDFAVYGRGWAKEDGVRNPESVPYLEQLDCMASAEVAISFNNFSMVDGYFSARLLWATASGACVISDRFEGCETLFEHGKEILYFNNLDEAARHVEWALKNFRRATKIGKAARAKTLTEHGWAATMNRYRDIVTKERKRKPRSEQETIA